MPLKAKLTAGLRKPASFPAVEIEHSGIPALAFHTEAIFPRILDLHEQKSGAETRQNR
jgi:hypothetical protein